MIAVDHLIACALGELDADAERDVEAHVLSCTTCAARFEAFVRLGPAIAAVIRSGHMIAMPVTRALVERLDAEHLISRRYALAPGTIVPCTVGATDIYSLTVYEAELTAVTRVDLVRNHQRFQDVPFDRAGNRIYMLSAAVALRPLPSMQLPLELLAVEADGLERSLGRYTLDHTAFAPPP